MEGTKFQGRPKTGATSLKGAESRRLTSINCVEISHQIEKTGPLYYPSPRKERILQSRFSPCRPEKEIVHIRTSMKPQQTQPLPHFRAFQAFSPLRGAHPPPLDRFADRFPALPSELGLSRRLKPFARRASPSAAKLQEAKWLVTRLVRA